MRGARLDPKVDVMNKNAKRAKVASGDLRPALTLNNALLRELLAATGQILKGINRLVEMAYAQVSAHVLTLYGVGDIAF